MRQTDVKKTVSYSPKPILRLRMMSTKSPKPMVPSFLMYRSMIVIKIDDFSWKLASSRPSFIVMERETDEHRDRDTDRQRDTEGGGGGRDI